jgi:hypothetical protein
MVAGDREHDHGDPRDIALSACGVLFDARC